MPPPETPEPLVEFAAGLLSAGKVVVRRSADLKAGLAAAEALLAEAHAAVIDDLAAGSVAPPPFVPAMAMGSLLYLYRSCVALVDRTMREAEVHMIHRELPDAASAGEVLSADVCLRHLPELFQMARAVSENDPLLDGLKEVAQRFPLSSVGMELPAPPNLSLLQEHAGLWRLYIDRVVERQDASRLADAAVCAAVRDTLGAHTGLAPKLGLKLTLSAP